MEQNNSPEQNTGQDPNIDQDPNIKQDHEVVHELLGTTAEAVQANPVENDGGQNGAEISGQAEQSAADQTAEEGQSTEQEIKPKNSRSDEFKKKIRQAAAISGVVAMTFGVPSAVNAEPAARPPQPRGTQSSSSIGSVDNFADQSEKYGDQSARSFDASDRSEGASGQHINPAEDFSQESMERITPASSMGDEANKVGEETTEETYQTIRQTREEYSPTAPQTAVEGENWGSRDDTPDNGVDAKFLQSQESIPEQFRNEQPASGQPEPKATGVRGFLQRFKR